MNNFVVKLLKYNLKCENNYSIVKYTLISMIYFYITMNNFKKEIVDYSIYFKTYKNLIER